jgi:hypothetical protein
MYASIKGGKPKKKKKGFISSIFVMRNESDIVWDQLFCWAPSADPETLLKGLSKSISVGTRKTVNYA